jgi:preprotein translocase subunit SecY
LQDFFKSFQGTIFYLYDIFSGGNLSRMTLFALGVMPYISASIMMQLLTVAVPELQRLAKEEGDYGRYKINQYTRYLTLLVAFVQSMGVALWLRGQVSPKGIPLVPEGGVFFIITTVVALVSSTMFLMWVGDRITEKGIGNGMSLLIFAGIVAGFPNAIIRVYEMLRNGDLTPFAVVGAIVFVLLVTFGIVFMQEAERRIPVQHPRRQIGRQEVVGGSTYLTHKDQPSGRYTYHLCPVFANHSLHRAWFYPASHSQSPARCLQSNHVLLQLSVCYVYSLFHILLYRGFDKPGGGG